MTCEFSELYRNTTEELKRRIMALIPEHPEIMTITDSWDLFKVPGFYCYDLEPTMAQADAAFSLAKAEWRRNHSER